MNRCSLGLAEYFNIIAERVSCGVELIKEYFFANTDSFAAIRFIKKIKENILRFTLTRRF